MIFFEEIFLIVITAQWLQSYCNILLPHLTFKKITIPPPTPLILFENLLPLFRFLILSFLKLNYFLVICVYIY